MWQYWHQDSRPSGYKTQIHFKIMFVKLTSDAKKYDNTKRKSRVSNTSSCQLLSSASRRPLAENIQRFLLATPLYISNV